MNRIKDGGEPLGSQGGVPSRPAGAEDRSCCWCWDVWSHWSCNRGWGGGGFPSRDQLDAGEGGGWCGGAESSSHLFLASARYSVKPTRAVTAAPRATRSQKEAAPSSVAFRWLQRKREKGSEGGARGWLPRCQVPGRALGEHGSKPGPPRAGAPATRQHRRAKRGLPALLVERTQALPCRGPEIAHQHLNN